MEKCSKISVKLLTFGAVMLAVEIVLSRFVVFYLTPGIKISIAFIPVAMAARRHPVLGVCVGALSDVIGALLFPVGAYFPGFTLSAALNGLIYGIVIIGTLQGKWGYIKTVAAAFLQQAVCGVLLNSLWLSMLYGKGFNVWLGDRLINAAIMLPLQILLLLPTLKATDKIIKNI